MVVPRQYKDERRKYSDGSVYISIRTSERMFLTVVLRQYNDEKGVF